MLDLFRIAAAFLVAAIHIAPFELISADVDLAFTYILGRIAVPFFLMVTGCFVLGMYLTEEGSHFGTKQFEKIKRYLVKLLKIYSFSVVLYLPIGIYAGNYSDMGIWDIIRMLLFDGTFYHLWYFPACIVGILLVCGFNELFRKITVQKKLACILGVSSFLYLIGLLGDSWYGMISGSSVISEFYDVIFSVSSYTRNGVFMAPVFLALGAAAGSVQLDKKKKAQYGVLAASAFLLMEVEGFVLHKLDFCRHDSMYLLLPAVMYFIFVLLRQDKKEYRELRVVSTWIYILHPAMIVVVRFIVKLLAKFEVDAGFMVENPLVLYGLVCLFSVFAAADILFIKDMKKKKQEEKAQKALEAATSRAWIEVSLEALEKNVNTLRELLPDNTDLMPAVKANAYGHGAVSVAKKLQELHVNAFCVATAQEGVELRKNGITGEILILGYTSAADFHFLTEYTLSQTIVDKEYAEELNDYNGIIHVHIGADTGMHRLGIPSENVDEVSDVFSMKNLVVDGMFTHLSASDDLSEEGKQYTEEQIAKFYRLVSCLKERGIVIPKLHLLASYGAVNYSRYGEDYARVGILLYGVHSNRACANECGVSFTPVLSLKARVSVVRDLKEGECAGYGMDYRAKKDVKIAVLTIGYADGLPRELSEGKGAVLIHGRRADIIGRICMDQTLVDVSGISDVKAGDVAVLVGTSGTEEISVLDIAEEADTITNEVLSRFGGRLARIVVS